MKAIRETQGKATAPAKASERSEPLAARGNPPPTVNTGGQSQPVVVLDGRELKIVTVRSPVLGNFSHIDSLRFTTKEMAFDPLRQCVTEFDFMDSMRHFLKTVFGFTTFEKQDKGRDFYLWSFIIGDKKCQLGAVCRLNSADSVPPVCTMTLITSLSSVIKRKPSNSQR